jgi:hypothetical protein
MSELQAWHCVLGGALLGARHAAAHWGDGWRAELGLFTPLTAALGAAAGWQAWILWGAP